jgi:hypothetical protein
MDKPGQQQQPAQQPQSAQRQAFQSTHPAVHSSALPAVEDAQALRDVSKALFAMRDALTKLSLALKDWQFEHDLTKRDHVQGITQSLFASLASPPKNKPDQAPLP